MFPLHDALLVECDLAQVEDARRDVAACMEEAASVDEGLALARQTRFDVLFVDFKMPNRNGTELIRELMGAYTLAQMVLISGLPELAQGEALAGLGGVALLPKPLSAEGLAACVERVTGMRLPAA